jgi:predicted dehydrogenase
MDTKVAKNSAEIGLGVIGCGGFGLYALQQFAQVPGVKLVAMAGTSRPAARAAAQRFGIPDIEAVDALLGRTDIDLVYIATPPFLHFPQAIAGLEAGMHVICEKPLAMTIEQADALIAAGRKHDRLVVANLMQRYNPIYEIVGRLIGSQVLGEVLHGYFENYASDENLPPDHWFWDLAKSGGIFIEHGVHFFDMFAGWLGAGTVVAAERGVRPGSSPCVEEQVHCTVRYGSNVLVNFYHGFHQTGRMDRQELRLVFERGDVTLYDWVPTRVRIHAIVDEAQTRSLCELFRGARLDVSATYPPKDRTCNGRGKTLDVYQMVELNWGDGTNKSIRYSELLRAMMTDQLAWIRDRSHRRKITEENGRDSLAAACAADLLARAHGESCTGTR